ncbi:MAG: dipeptidase [Solirubrobacteraceae bacterium]|nr:dipeptidase [Solirubrobacteraceae bacterium]
MMPAERRRIFAMGGGGFAEHPGDPALDDFVVGLARRDPRICLLPTAGGDAEGQIVRFHAAFDDLPCEPSHISLFRLGRRPVALRDHLLRQDIVYVGGGSMLNMLAIWRAHGLDRIMREAWEAGVVLCGISAGSMCWFTGGITTSTGRPAPGEGLGLLPHSNSVHYGSEPARRHAYVAAVREGALPDGFAVDDGVGLLFEGQRLAGVVSAREGAGAVRVQRTRAEVHETPLPVDLLGPDPRDASVPADIVELRRARGHPPSSNRLGARRAGLPD